MKVLINVPDLNSPGGVAVLFKLLKLPERYDDISYFYITGGRLNKMVRLPLKFLHFIFRISKVDIVHLNPSLNNKSFLRDALFAFIALVFSKKLIIYWHGWDTAFEEKIKKSYILKEILFKTFLKSNKTIVLGTIFKEKLLEFGYENQVFIETNAAENNFIVDLIDKPPLKTDIRLLFLSRIEKEKGIYLAIDTVNALNALDKNRNYFLDIAGTGSEEFNVKKICKYSNNLRWHGYTEAELKHKLLRNADIMFFPTCYPEGMPLTLLEGMIYGLPIITRPMGGISDLVIQGENGFLLESISFKDFLSQILLLVDNPITYKKISINNLEKSKMFMPSEVQNRLFSIYKNLFYD